MNISSHKAPDFKGFLDDDIIKRIEGVNILWGDAINMQLIADIRKLTDQLAKSAQSKEGDV